MTTRARQGEVDRFNNSTDIPVFLISLKAGGTGLNLTSADTVIHFDPWWNPAVEAQATDRAHRIGQSRVVTSYKLICTGTVEEKVLQLQESKRALLADVFDASDAASAKLSLADLKSLLTS
jgi:SNF2 family DNA or RNA helicase